jgi:seryl-tRNA synthetase
VLQEKAEKLMNEKMSMMEKQQEYMQREANSAQTVMDLKSEISALKSQKESTSSSTELSELRSKVEDLRKQLTAKNEEVSVAQSNISSLTVDLEAARSTTVPQASNTDFESEDFRNYVKEKVSEAVITVQAESKTTIEELQQEVMVLSIVY